MIKKKKTDNLCILMIYSVFVFGLGVKQLPYRYQGSKLNLLHARHVLQPYMNSQCGPTLLLSPGNNIMKMTRFFSIYLESLIRPQLCPKIMKNKEILTSLWNNERVTSANRVQIGFPPL